MIVETVPIATLTPHPRNPRRGNVNAIAESIARFGQFKPLTVQRSTGHVLAGNHTLEALRGLGHDTVPVVYLDVDDDTALAVLLADNRTSDLGGYDDKELARILNDAQAALDGTGYDAAFIDRITRTSGLLAETMSADFAAQAADARADALANVAPKISEARAEVGYDNDVIALKPSMGAGYNPNAVTGPNGETLVQLVVLMTDEQRDDTVAALHRVRQEHDLPTIGAALHHLATT